MSPCPVCRLEPDGSDKWGGPDPCLGLLPGVIGACCGHGGQRVPYLWTETWAYAGAEAVRLMRERGGNPPPGDYPAIVPHPLSAVSRSRA